MDWMSHKAAQEQRRQAPLWAACGPPMPTPACCTPRAALNAQLHPQTQESARGGKALRARPEGLGQGRRGLTKGTRIRTARGRPGAACGCGRQRPSPEVGTHTRTCTHTHTHTHMHTHTHTKQQKPLLLGQPQTPVLFTLRGSTREGTRLGEGGGPEQAPPREQGGLPGLRPARQAPPAGSLLSPASILVATPLAPGGRKKTRAPAPGEG